PLDISARGKFCVEEEIQIYRLATQIILIEARINFCFFFNATATTEIYTLSLHDALPICIISTAVKRDVASAQHLARAIEVITTRSEEHTSELQSRGHLVCRLLLEKKNMHQEIDTILQYE